MGVICFIQALVHLVYTHISTKNVINLNIGICYVPTITICATIEIVVLIVE